MYYPQFPDKPIYSHPLGGYVKFSYLALWEETVSMKEIGRQRGYVSKLIYDDEDEIIEILILIAGKLN